MAKTVQGSLLKKLGADAKKAWKQHAKDETKLSSAGELPPIENGIAQLVDIKIGTYETGNDKGKLYFSAQGIVVAPDQSGGIPVTGLRTRIGPEPLFATPTRSRKTLDEHIAWMMNELRKLGIDTNSIDIDDLETTVFPALLEQAPHFRFRTWKGKPATEGKYKGQEPRVNHDWRGVVEFDAESGEATGGVEVEEDGEEEADATVDVAALLEAANNDDEDAQTQLVDLAVAAGHKRKTVQDLPDWESVAALLTEADEEAEAAAPEEEEEATEEEVDFDTLGSEADEGDGDAQAKLNELGEAAGLSEADYGTWAEFATAISEASGGEEEAEAEAEYEPVVKEVVKYKPKGAKKAVDCEVTAVFAKNKTLSLLNLDDEKVYKGVAWSEVDPS